VFLSWSEYRQGFSQLFSVKAELYEQICPQRPRPPGHQTPNITAGWSSILWKLHTVWQQCYQALRFRTLADTAIIICQQIKLITRGLLEENAQDKLIPVIKEVQLHSDVWGSKDIASCMLSHSDHLLAGSISLHTLYCNPSHHESPTKPMNPVPILKLTDPYAKLSGPCPRDAVIQDTGRTPRAASQHVW
jgi:hypothetical protein